jgi:hypothetical protein
MTIPREPKGTGNDPVTDALRTYPLADSPPGLEAGIFSRLRALPAGVRPKFRLHWYDFAISAFTTSMAGLGFVLWQSVPPPVMARLQVEGLIWFHRLIQMVPGLAVFGQ